jgi:DNA-binding transcriptional MerR regulator
MEEPWTILELAELAADALAATQPTSPYAGPRAAAGGQSGVAGAPAVAARANGRVRDVPNERLVRWYVTVGLVDPPLSRRGRVARYGQRHLLQLVAVKRRQAEGRSLAEIQAELAGATDETLAAVARLGDAPAATPARPAAPGRFWARQPRGPVPAALAAPRHGGTGRAGERGEEMEDAEGRDGGTNRGGAGGVVYGVRLALGVTVLLEGAGREPGPEDLTEIANAAEPLLRELASRGLRADDLDEGAGHDH